MTTIITDVTSLRQISRTVQLTDPKILGDDPKPLDLVSKETEDVIYSLLRALPQNGLGLSAPQIGVFERIFVARLSNGTFIFINPRITKSDTEFASTEGCLSLPGVVKCISRSNKVSIEADIIYRHSGIADPVSGDTVFTIIPGMEDLYLINAAIVQHEYDHLEGVLIIDYAEAPSLQKKIVEKDYERRKRIMINRKLRAAKSQHKLQQKVTKINPKRAKKLEKLFKQEDKRNKRRVKIEEYHKAINKGTFSSPTLSDNS